MIGLLVFILLLAAGLGGAGLAGVLSSTDDSGTPAPDPTAQAADQAPADPGIDSTSGDVSEPAPAPVTSFGGILSASDLASLAASAGFIGSDLVVAIAIALAESGGDPTQYNPEKQAGTPPGQGSYGLWQIYLYKHPEDAGVDLYDPHVNASAAFSVYSNAGRSFRPWSTFNTYDASGKKLVSVGTGVYRKHLAEATAAVNA